MGQQIVIQPNGLFAVWSSVVDDFVLEDATQEDVVEEFIAEYKRDLIARVDSKIKSLLSGGSPYYQFTMSYQECLATKKEVHG